MPPARRTIIFLTAMCLVAYCVGLTNHGLANWQEAQRALVAREMQQHGSWLIPMAAGHPYLAKPPLMYWCQLAIAAVRGGTTGLFELRLTVALGGVAGVLATYLVGRRLFAAPDPGGDPSARARWADQAALWGALCLATGTLYFRYSRVGMLDILLVPCVVVCIGAIHAAYVSHVVRNRTGLLAVAVATLSATLGVLVKGPPALIVPLLGGFGGIAAWELLGKGGRPWPRRLADLWRAYSRTHPVAVLGLPLLVLYAWLRYVASVVGPEAVRLAVEVEAADNLRLLEPWSILRNLEAVSYGVGLGSLAAVVSVVWIVKDRPRMNIGWSIVLCWVALSLVAFSTLGKGVTRYLIPVFPGIALLGGMWIASALRDLPWRGVLRCLIIAALAALWVGQTWWYAFGRERYHSDSSPRDLVSAMTAPDSGIDPSRLVLLGFADPAIDYYLGHPVETFLTRQPPSMQIWEPERPLSDLAEQLRREDRPMFMLAQGASPGVLAEKWYAELAQAGLVFEPVPISASYLINSRKTTVVLGQVTPKLPH